MPCLNLSTNVSLDGVDTSAILSEATSTVAKIIGKPEAVRSSCALYASYVCDDCVKGIVPIAFGGTEQPAAYGELVSIGGLGPDVNKKLSAAISAILETKLSVSKSRFFLKFYDTKASNLNLPIKVKNMHSVCMLYTSTRSWFQLWMEWYHLLRPASCLGCPQAQFHAFRQQYSHGDLMVQLYASFGKKKNLYFHLALANAVMVEREGTKGQREFEIEADGHANLLAPRTYYLKLLVFTTCLKEVLRLSSMEKIINGNLTSSKILTDEQTNADIAVFGLSRLMTTAASTNIIATAGSLSAPELSKLKNASTKSDVYNLGVIILELLKSPGEPANGIGWHP
ncbi:hypothetical protein GH714_018424 [Hevea brasiliensis]|uniref:Protein kinase domain-containing protein n=1 Tax=Hevea brasiliensis TaxID=3981 RepID=A0A6A6M103_HEVBR|nr:hypothetical protein GH714_018424 [Hevea brasiliensis]